MLVLAAAGALGTTLAAPATAATAPCVSADDATYRHTFDGAGGTATITAVRPLCKGQSQSFALVSYTAGAPSANAGQFVYSTDRDAVTAARRSVTLEVAVPRCYTQVDAIFGTELTTESTHPAAPYSDTMLGAASGPGRRSAGPLAWYRGGSTACTPAPKVSYTNACDGTFTATLANDAGAGVTAVFVTDGRLVRLAPGRSTTLRAPAGGTLTVRDSTFTTYVGSWRPPATGCSSAAPSAPAAVPGSVPSRPGATATSAGTPSPALTTEAGDERVLAPEPVPTTTTPVAAPAAGGGRSAGSVLAIAFGVLLIGGGLFLLTRVLRTLRG